MLIGTSTWFICIGAILAVALVLSVIYSMYYDNRENENHIQVGFNMNHSELKILS